MIVFRLTKESYKNEISGIGAKINGGRWNSKGASLVYTGSSRALCTTEIAVHSPLGIVPMDYYLQIIRLPSSKSLEIYHQDLAKGWNSFPHITATKKIGDTFVQSGKELVLKVPSAVVQGEFNFLLNPAHKSFSKVKIIEVEAFRFDKRLFVQ